VRAPEQAVEEVAEAATRSATGEYFLEVEIAGSAAIAAGRLHLVAGPVSTGAQLVVGLALPGIAQRLVSLVDGLELLLGPRLLADIRVEFARQPSISRLDLRLTSIGLHAQRVVVILELLSLIHI